MPGRRDRRGDLSHLYPNTMMVFEISVDPARILNQKEGGTISTARAVVTLHMRHWRILR